MIDNIEDARRKLNSFNDVESAESARWLIEQSRREAGTAMTASDFQAKDMLSDYLWSRYLKPDIGAAILYQAFPATYSMQVLKEHPNKYLKIAAARMLGGWLEGYVEEKERSHARRSEGLPSRRPDATMDMGRELINTPQYKAAAIEHQLVSETISGAPGRDDILAKIIIDKIGNDASLAALVKEMLCDVHLPRTQDNRLAGRWEHRTLPLKGLGILLEKFPDKADPVLLKNALDKRYEWALERSTIDALRGWMAGEKKLSFKNAAEQKQYQAMSKQLLKDAAIGIASQNVILEGEPMGTLQSLMVEMNPMEAGYFVSQLPAPVSDGAKKVYAELGIWAAIKNGDWNSVFKVVSADPAPYKTMIESMLSGTSYGKDIQKKAIGGLLPLVYNVLNQGFMSRLWDASDDETNLLTMQSVGKKWSANVLVHIAEGESPILAAEAAKILMQRNQANLVPEKLRDMEL